MLRVSREADLGIVLLTRFARAPERTVATARELAGDAKLPLPMTSKILKRLARAGLLVSQLGARGGYALARSPESVSVLEILEALEGPIALTNCIEHAPRECDRESFCSVKSNWQLINRRMQATLASISLREMTGPLTETASTVDSRPLRRGGHV